MEYNIFYTSIILVPVVAFATAVILKGIFSCIADGKFSLARAFGSGGMPSVHSAVVVSTTTAITLKHGIGSDLFALALAFTLIIIYDAINVRFEAGLHATAINQAIWEKRFKESLGHLPSEAFAWSVLGIVTALILFYI